MKCAFNSKKHCSKVIHFMGSFLSAEALKKQNGFRLTSNSKPCNIFTCFEILTVNNFRS